MRALQFALFFFFVGLAAPALAQRDAGTSSARAAYSMPSTGYSQKKKEKKKNKVRKRKTKPKKARKTDTDAARVRRRSLSF